MDTACVCKCMLSASASFVSFKAEVEHCNATSQHLGKLDVLLRMAETDITHEGKT